MTDTAGQVLRALIRESDPNYLSYDNQGCIWCWAMEPEGYPSRPTLEDFASLTHEPDCVWRRAYEWVHQHPA